MGQDLIIYQENGFTVSFCAVEGNTDYQEYLEWIAQGNTPQPWQPE